MTEKNQTNFKQSIRFYKLITKLNVWNTKLIQYESDNSKYNSSIINKFYYEKGYKKH